MRRVTAGVSTMLLAALSVAVAEGALLLLLLVFSSVLRLNLVVQLGDQVVQVWLPQLREPTVTIRHAGILGSIAFTFACGAAAAGLRYRRWRPA